MASKKKEIKKTPAKRPRDDPTHTEVLMTDDSVTVTTKFMRYSLDKSMDTLGAAVRAKMDRIFSAIIIATEHVLGKYTVMLGVKTSEVLMGLGISNEDVLAAAVLSFAAVGAEDIMDKIEEECGPGTAALVKELAPPNDRSARASQIWMETNTPGASPDARLIAIARAWVAIRHFEDDEVDCGDTRNWFGMVANAWLVVKDCIPGNTLYPEAFNTMWERLVMHVHNLTNYDTEEDDTVQYTSVRFMNPDEDQSLKIPAPSAREFEQDAITDAARKWQNRYNSWKCFA